MCVRRLTPSGAWWLQPKGRQTERPQVNEV